MLVAHLEPAQEVTFYSDAACQDAIYSTTQDTCYTNSLGAIASFIVSTKNSTTKELVVASSIKLSNYTGLANRDPYEVIKFTRLVGLISFGTGLYAAYGAFTVLTAYNAFGACKGATGGEPFPTSICVSTLVTTVAAISLPYISKKFKHELAAFLTSPGGASTATVNVKRRELLDSANHQYMLHMMNITSLHGDHVGSIERENQHGEMTRSPLFEVDIGNSTWHMAAFMDPESGEFIHHLHDPSQTELAQRSTTLNTRAAPAKAGYGDIKWVSAKGRRHPHVSNIN